MFDQIYHFGPKASDSISGGAQQELFISVAVPACLLSHWMRMVQKECRKRSGCKSDPAPDGGLGADNKCQVLGYQYEPKVNFRWEKCFKPRVP